MELAVIIIMILGKYFAVIGAQVAILGTRPGAPGATIAGCIANLISIRTLHIDKIVMAGHKVTKAVPEFQINEYTIWDIRLEIYIYIAYSSVLFLSQFVAMAKAQPSLETRSFTISVKWPTR